MVRSKMSIRGHERFVTKPLSITTNLGRQPTAMDMQRRAILQMQEEEAARMKTQRDFEVDFLDFSYLTGVDDYGLPLSTPYAVPDSVSDLYVPEMAPASSEENSVSNEGSGNEPSGGTE